MDSDLEIGTTGRTYDYSSFDVLETFKNVPKAVVDTAVNVPTKVISTVIPAPITPENESSPPVLAVGQPPLIGRDLFNRIRVPQGSTNYGKYGKLNYSGLPEVYPAGRPTSVPVKALQMINTVPRKFAGKFASDSGSTWTFNMLTVVGVITGLLIGTKWGQRGIKKVPELPVAEKITKPVINFLED